MFCCGLPLVVDMVVGLIETVATDAVHVGAESLKLQERIDELAEKCDEIKTANASIKVSLLWEYRARARVLNSRMARI